MQLQDLYQRVFDRRGSQLPVKGLPEILDENFQDTEAILMRPSFAQRAEKHPGYLALVGNHPETVLEKGLLFAPQDQALTGAEICVVALPSESQHDMNALLRLECAQLIFFVLDTNERLTSHQLRWLARLEILKVPIIILVNHCERIQKHLLPQMLDKLRTRLNLPVVPVLDEDLDESRELLVETVIDISPRLTGMLSRQSPALRPALVQHVLHDAAQNSLELPARSIAQEPSPLLQIQMRLTQQIKGIYGKGSRLTPEEQQSLLTMVTTANHYATNFTSSLPTRNSERRTRVTNAVSTLILGYLTLVSHGETPPDIRTQILPYVWRLYRASGKMANQ